MEAVLNDSGGVLTALLGCRNQQRFFSLVTPPLWPWPELQGGHLTPILLLYTTLYCCWASHQVRPGRARRQGPAVLPILTTERNGAQAPSVQGWAQSRAQSPWGGRCAALLFRVAGRGLLAELVHELEETAQLGLPGAQRTAGGRPGRRASCEHSPQRAAYQLPVACAELLE